MKRTLPLLALLLLGGCMAPLTALKIGYVAVRAVVTVVEVLRPNEPAPEEVEDDGEETQ
jgi:hypothetical protein